MVVFKWDAARRFYEIFYKGALGRQHRCRRGFHVPKADEHGNPLDAEAFHERRLKTLDRARRLWKDADKTDAKRFEAK